MSILSDQRALANGNLPAGVTDADCGGTPNELPSLRRYLNGDIFGRIPVSFFMKNFQGLFADEVFSELVDLVSASDEKKVDFVNWILSELQASHERHNG